MEQTKNLDVLLAKMAHPTFYKKICLLYDKKQTFKYKNKANVHDGRGKIKHRFFNESEECRKTLDFIGNQDVTTLISKQETVANVSTEFSPGKYVKNYVDATKSSHEMSDFVHKQRHNSKPSSSDFPSKHVSSVSDAIGPSKNVKEKRGNDFSSKGKLSLKSTFTDVTTLSSDSSEEETYLVRKSTLNKGKCEKKSVTSRAKNKPRKVSKGFVVTNKQKSKGKSLLQDAHISPKKEFSKRRENELLVHSDSDKQGSNKKRIRKKSVKGDSLGTTPTRNNVLLKPGISTPYRQFIFQDVEQDDIITISTDSLVSSDADTYEKVLDENSPKKLKVQKNKCKRSKRFLNSFIVDKPSNISKTIFCKFNSKSIRNDSVDDTSDDDVCLLDSPNLSKRDVFPTTKEYTSSKLPTVKDKFVLEKKNSMKNIERSRKLCIPNRIALKKCNSRVCSAESNISLTVKNKTFENVEKCRYGKNCLSDCSESIENADEPLFNSRKNYLKSFEKTTINKNRKKDNSEKLTNLKTLTGSKTFNSTKSRNNSEDSFIDCHSDISSNGLSYSNPNLASNELHSSSDDDVLFQGFYKAIDSFTNNKGYKSSEKKTVFQKDTPFILQSNNLKNPNKGHKFDKDTIRGSANDDRSFARSNSSKIGSLEEVVGEANFAKEVSRSNFIFSKQIELNIQKFDLIPEPVNFEIPLLHEYEHVYVLPKEHIAKLKEHGLSTGKKARFTPEEDEILKKNFMEFSMEYGISDPAMVFGIYSDHKLDSTLRKFLRVKHFYVRLGKNLNDRTLKSIYHRARIIYHPHHSPNPNRWTSEEISKLKELQKMYGNNWNKIGSLLNRRGNNCQSAFSRFSMKGKT